MIVILSLDKCLLSFFLRRRRRRCRWRLFLLRSICLPTFLHGLVRSFARSINCRCRMPFELDLCRNVFTCRRVANKWVVRKRARGESLIRFAIMDEISARRALDVRRQLGISSSSTYRQRGRWRCAHYVAERANTRLVALRNDTKTERAVQECYGRRGPNELSCTQATRCVRQSTAQSICC